MKRIQKAVGILAATALLGASSASALTFTASSGSLAASATFSASGNYLTVELENTSAIDVLNPSQILTAIFFDYTSPPTLTRVSAVVASGSTVLFGTTDPGNVVGGEWAYAGGLTGTPGSAALGISSSGLGLFGPSDTFPGSNLQGPASPDGLQYGITSAGDNPTTGNSAVTGNNALIKNKVIFTFSGMTGYALEDLQIRNVSFQYGTALTEPNVPVPTPDGGSTVLLLGMAFVGVALVGRRNRRYAL
jgi:hypothetical protein